MFFFTTNLCYLFSKIILNITELLFAFSLTYCYVCMVINYLTTTANLKTMATKQDEIKMLEQMLNFVNNNPNSYLAEFFTSVLVQQMQSNIANDFPVDQSIGYQADESVEKSVQQLKDQMEEMKKFYDDERKELRLKCNNKESQLEMILTDLIMEEDHMKIAYQYFDNRQILKAKVMNRPNSLSEEERDTIVELVLA